MKIKITGQSLFRGEVDEIKTEAEVSINFRKIPVIEAFLKDNDLAEMTVCSPNIGFVYTFTKIEREEQ